jgi:hypothetical protein
MCYCGSQSITILQSNARAAKIRRKVNHDSPLAQLAPFLDDRGHIRLGGRIEAANLEYSAKYPLLLHPKDPFTIVLGRHIHILLCHTGGPRAIITELNKRFWCPKSTSLFRTIPYKCVRCQKRLAKPTKQIMAHLLFYRQPSARLHPFDYCAMDVAGPYKTKFGRSEVKRCLLILRCCTIGAVHCEMIDLMDTSSFLLAIEQCLALRPRPSVFFCNQGTSFKGGESSMQERAESK